MEDILLEFSASLPEKWNLSEVSTEGRRFLKVPIAPLGNWKHKKYGDVSFTQKDFDTAISNWKISASGYEPPLYLGHPVSTNTVDGAPAAAFLERLYQEDNVLFGDFDPVDESVYKDVQEGKYRYSSAEVVRNALSKRDGKNIGTLLTAVALTNQPFLTGMPRVQALSNKEQFSDSQDNRLFFHFNLFSHNNNMTKPEEVLALSVTEDAPKTQSPTPTTLSSQDTERFSELAQLVETQRRELDKLIEVSKQQRIDAKVKEIYSLNLSAEVKQMYSDLVRSDALSVENEAKIDNILKTLSEENKQKYSESQGDTQASASRETPTFVNPYEETIQRIQKQAEERKSRAQV